MLTFLFGGIENTFQEDEFDMGCPTYRATAERGELLKATASPQAWTQEFTTKEEITVGVKKSQSQ